jgi:hypothetical protein
MSVRIFWDVTLRRWISGSFPTSTGAAARPEDQNAQLLCCEDLTIHVCFVNTLYLNFQNSCTEFSVHSDDWNINSAVLLPYSRHITLALGGVAWPCYVRRKANKYPLEVRVALYTLSHHMQYCTISGVRKHAPTQMFQTPV